MQIDTCDLPIKVNVVSERARDNLYVPPKEVPIPWQTVIIVAAILVVIALIVLYLWEKRHLVRRLKKRE